MGHPGRCKGECRRGYYFIDMSEATPEKSGARPLSQRAQSLHTRMTETLGWLAAHGEPVPSEEVEEIERLLRDGYTGSAVIAIRKLEAREQELRLLHDLREVEAGNAIAGNAADRLERRGWVRRAKDGSMDVIVTATGRARLKEPTK